MLQIQEPQLAPPKPVAFKMPAPAVAWSSISSATLELILHCASFFPSIFQMQVFKRGSYGLNLLMCLGSSFQTSYWLSWGLGSRAHRKGISQAQEECAKGAEPTPLGVQTPKKWREDLKGIPIHSCSEKHDSQQQKCRSNSDVCQLLNRQMGGISLQWSIILL